MLKSKFSLASVSGISFPQDSMPVTRNNLYTKQNIEAYSEPCQTSKDGAFRKNS